MAAARWSSVRAGGRVYVASLDWPTLAHELGHNMSLQHANYLACVSDAVQTSTCAFRPGYAGTTPGCGELEYGDGLDVMSSAHGSANNTSAVALRRLGVLQGSDAVDVTASGTTRHRLNSLSTGTGLRSVMVTDPRSGNRYYSENRQPTGRDAYGWGGGGVSGPLATTYGVRVLKVSPSGGSHLLDPTPTADPYNFDNDQTVAVGSTFATAGGGVEIRTTGVSGGVATVEASVAAAGAQHWLTPVPNPNPTSNPTPTPTPTPTPLTSPSTTSPTTPPTSNTGTTTTTVSAPTTAVVGKQVVVTSTVAAATAVAGRVTVEVGGVTTSVAVMKGAYTARLTSKSAGAAMVRATFTPASAALESSVATANLVVEGEPVRVTAAVTVPKLATGVPATIIGKVGAATAATVTVTLGRVRTTVPVSGGAYSATLTPVGAGKQNLTVVYSGAAPNDSVYSTATLTRAVVVTAATQVSLAPLPTAHPVGTHLTLAGEVLSAATANGTITLPGGASP